MSKEMLINVSEGEECRLAILEGGILQELYAERATDESQVGNIYKGRVTNVEPSIQAAFIDFGALRNGFLHISDLQAQYFPKGKRVAEPVGKKTSRKDRPPIQDCLRRGQDVVCQVIKAGIGTKGPTLTTYLSIPGRFVVMMPGMSHLGVSRKIEDEDERLKLRKILDEIGPPDDIGFIARTASLGRTKRDLQADLHYLQRLWRSVERRMKKAKAPTELYQESDLVIRTIRDVYSSEISRIICDDSAMTHKVADFLKVAMPRGKNVVQLYTGAVPLFHRYGLEHELEKIYSRHVDLPGGGSLVIDQAEALVAIDVNSGRNRSANDAEETAYRTNIIAAKEVARQLRLRDMGGVIVIDFIDMRFDRHQRELERVLRDHIKKDRARSKVLRLSPFGLIQMTRQRIRPSLKSSIYCECPHCNASGLIKSPESLAISIIRNLRMACGDERIDTIDLTVSPLVADFLNNRRRAQLSHMETESGKTITIQSDPTLAGDALTIECRDDRGGMILWNPPGAEQGPTPLGATRKAMHTTMGAPQPGELVDATDLPALPPSAEGPVMLGAGFDPEADEPELEADELEADQAEADEAEADEAELAEPAAEAVAVENEPKEAEQGEAATKKKRRRRGGRKHRRKKDDEAEAVEPLAEPVQAEPAAEPTPVASEEEEPAEADAKKKRRRRGGRRHRRKNVDETAAMATPADLAAAVVEAPAAEQAAKPAPRPTRRRRAKKAMPAEAAPATEVAPAAKAAPANGAAPEAIEPPPKAAAKETPKRAARKRTETTRKKAGTVKKRTATKKRTTGATRKTARKSTGKDAAASDGD